MFCVSNLYYIVSQISAKRVGGRTYLVHVPYDDLTDLLGGRDLCLLSEHATNHRPQDEHDTLACIHSIHVRRACTLVADQPEHMVDDLRDVPLQPDHAHAPHKLHICLQKV